MSRTKNTFRNIAFGYLEEIVILILSFITRRIFVEILGAQYNGLNSVIANILGTLNLVELGFGSAIIYNLYKPLAQKDEEHIKALMDFYKRTYQVIGGVIAGIGICILPFLPHLIKDELSFTNIYVVFGLQLLQTVSTYLFFAYKRSLLEADQKSYLVSKIRSIYILLLYLGQIIVLKVSGEYIPYLLVTVAGTILLNLLIALRADKEYPLLRRRDKVSIETKERKEIIENCFALFIYKINSSVLNATDSLILSKFVGLTIVGYYGHYLTIVTAVKSILNKVFVALTGSLGNLHAESSMKASKNGRLEHEEKVFRAICLMSFAAFGMFGVGIFAVSNVFIDLWIGPGQTLPQMAVFLITTEILLYSFAKPTASFRASMGLFQQCKYRPVASMVLNLVISLALVKPLGIVGVLIGTVASIALTTMWFDPMVIYRHGFKMSPKPYYFRIFMFTVVEGFSVLAVFLLLRMTKYEGVLGVFIYGVFAVLVFTVFLIIFLHRFSEFEDLKYLVHQWVGRIPQLLKKTR